MQECTSGSLQGNLQIIPYTERQHELEADIGITEIISEVFSQGTYLFIDGIPMTVHGFGDALDAAVVQKVLTKNFSAVTLIFPVVCFGGTQMTAGIVSQNAPVGD